MVKLRRPETIEDAALEAMTVMGPDHAGRVAGGISGAAVRAWSDPDKPANVPSAHQMLAVDAACMRHPGGPGRAPFLHAYVAVLRNRTRPGPPKVGGLIEELLDIPEAVGALSHAVRASRARGSDGGARITASEEHKIRAAIKNVRQELEDLEVSLGMELNGGAPDAHMAKGGGL